MVWKGGWEKESASTGVNKFQIFGEVLLRLREETGSSGAVGVEIGGEEGEGSSTKDVGSTRGAV